MTTDAEIRNLADALAQMLDRWEHLAKLKTIQKYKRTTQKERENRSMVTVESIKPITGAGNLRAFAIVNIADRLRVHDVRIIQQPNQEAWVSMPSRAYEKDGQRKWAPTIEILDDNLKAEISRAVLTEYKKGASTSAAAETAPWQ